MIHCFHSLIVLNRLNIYGNIYMLIRNSKMKTYNAASSVYKAFGNWVDASTVIVTVPKLIKMSTSDAATSEIPIECDGKLPVLQLC